jgi:hypothetical protein
MKISSNIRLVTKHQMSKFESFWIRCKRERAIFLRRPKTYGSPYKSVNDVIPGGGTLVSGD